MPLNRRFPAWPLGPLVALLVLIALIPALSWQHPTVPEDGYLILQGGGPAVPPILKDYLSYAGGSATNAVLIPTASEEAAELAPDRREHLQDRFRSFLGTANVTVLHTLDPKRADSEEFTAPIRRATLVWLMGGDDQLLANTYHGTSTEREIRAVLSRGGIVGGSSAGANVCGAFVFTHPAGQEATPLNDLAHYLLPLGFDFINRSAMMSHFSQRHLEKAIPKIREVHPELLVIGLDEATSIVVHNGIFAVAGPGTVSIYVPMQAGGNHNPFVLKDGQRFDLAKQSVVSLGTDRSK